MKEVGIEVVRPVARPAHMIPARDLCALSDWILTVGKGKRRAVVTDAVRMPAHKDQSADVFQAGMSNRALRGRPVERRWVVYPHLIPGIVRICVGI